MSTISVVVGNPRPRSRTYQAAVLVAERLAGKPPDLVVDLVDLGAGLLDGADPDVAAAVGGVQSCYLILSGQPYVQGHLHRAC